MIRKILPARLLAGLCAALISQGWAADSWRLLDPENVLLIETAKGRIVLEMRPDMAPLSVARVKLLSREKLYDGLQFHRVIPGFVAQTGNPDNRDGGASTHPDLALESVFSLTPGHGEQFVLMASDASAGLLGSVPFQGAPMSSVAKSGKTLRAWGAYCAGVAGMGRQESRDSANSEIFFMLDAARRLDRDYTVWVSGGIGAGGIESADTGRTGHPGGSHDDGKGISRLAARDTPQCKSAGRRRLASLN